MLRHKMILAVVLVAAPTAWWILSTKGCETVLFETFPDVDRTIVRKVHKEILRDAYQNKFPNYQGTKEEYIQIFMSKLPKFL